MQELAGKRKRISPAKAEGVARRYFEAIDARDLDAAVALWAEGGRENVRGQLDVLAPEGVRAFIGEHAGRLPGPADGGRLDHRPGGPLRGPLAPPRHLRGPRELRRHQPHGQCRWTSKGATC